MVRSSRRDAPSVCSSSSVDEALENRRAARRSDCARIDLEHALFAQALAAAVARVADTVGEEHEQVAAGIPVATSGGRLPLVHAERRIGGGEALEALALGEQERVRVARVRVVQLAGPRIDHGVERRDEHLGHRQLFAQRRHERVKHLARDR